MGHLLPGFQETVSLLNSLADSERETWEADVVKILYARIYHEMKKKGVLFILSRIV